MDITNPLDKLMSYIEESQFKGYDPYDALNSPILRLLSLNRKYLRIAFIQGLKRMPVNLRPVFGIAKGYNPKAIGLFLWGYTKLYRVEPKEHYLDKIKTLLGLLANLASPGYSGLCWGYNFDWQSRAFFVPAFTPTIVNSSFTGHALLDTYAYTGIERALEMALSIKNFIIKDINRHIEGDTFCFSYTPIDTVFVHNSNLLGASFLIRLCRYDKKENLKDTALRSLDYTMKYQRDDGSWYYAETDYQKWIDSFHTGFILQSIKYFFEEGYGIGDWEASFDKGVQFYSQKFFLSDGTPKYYHNRTYPIDIHSSTQGIVFFSRMGLYYRQLTERILKWTVNNMQARNGYFYFQKRRYHNIKIPYIRWAQAWAFHALTDYRFNYDKT